MDDTSVLIGNPVTGMIATEQETIPKKEVVENITTSSQEGQRVAILVDEYDKPMLQAIGNDALQKSFRNTLKAFYGALKSQDG